ncbi:MAG: hypothetical protein P1V97_00975 [Planctomycetota bacterium]|nr:hypothetical protein [Planctomycetota bacterium]
MNKVLVTLLTITLGLAAASPMVLAQDKDKDKKKKKFSATVTEKNKKKTVITEVVSRAGSSLFSSGAGKTEIEVRKDGGKLKINVPFEKIAKIKVLEVNLKLNYVKIELTTHKKAVLVGHVATNVEFAGDTEFGAAKIGIRDALEIVMKEMK